MNKKILLISCALIIAAASFMLINRIFIHPRWQIKNNPPTAYGPIVAFGDSLTAGYGLASEEQAYPALLSSILGRPVINMGVSGETIAAASNRLEKVMELSPSMVIILLGGNDILRRMNLDTSFAILEEMIEQIQSQGTLVFVVGLSGLPIVASTAKYYEETARKTGSVLIPDILKGILGKSNLMLDRIHPNAEGHRIMSERIADVVGRFLR